MQDIPGKRSASTMLQDIMMGMVALDDPAYDETLARR